MRDLFAHALAVVEYDGVLELVAGFCVSAPGRRRIGELSPIADALTVRRELQRVAGAREFLRAGGHWNIPGIPDAGPTLARLRVVGAVLSGAEVRQLLQLLCAGRLTLELLRREDLPDATRASLGYLTELLYRDAKVEREIERCIDDAGEVMDGASPALAKLRRQLSSAGDQVVGLLEKITSRLESHQRVPDLSVTVRDGRYVIAIRKEARNVVGGIVHDSSATGATLFVEPPAAVELGNRIRELEAEERREVNRILAALSDTLRPAVPMLETSLDALTELDAHFARAGYAERWGCTSPEVIDPQEGVAIHDGRHPLLLAQGIPVVPFTLNMVPGERTILISGPNTGGKTVLLKCVALFAAMTQSGIPIPAAAETRMPVFEGYFADVGDEQSIEASLSTFSAHLRNIRDILSRATPESLVLMDEIGSGTDPAEGAALAGAILEDLTRCGAITLATTHLGVLQQLSGEVQGVINASLQFDSARLAPTYEFTKGIPGRSYGLSMARRLGMPETIVARAEERMPEGERNLAVLLSELEQRERELRVREGDTRLRDDEIKSRAHRIAEREARVREREIEVEREARKGARRLLLEARSQVDDIIRDLRSSAAAAAESAEEKQRDARRKVEKLAQEQDAALRELSNSERAGKVAVPSGAVGVGDYVTVDSLGGSRGTVLELRDGMAVVAVGALKATIPLTGISRTAPPEKLSWVALRGEMPEEDARGEVDLRGFRLDEIDHELLPALDAAARSDLRYMRIIHGKGTGVLRKRVQEILSADPRVASMRDGAWNEGGTGVTVVELK